MAETTMVTTASSRISWKLPKLYRPRYSAKEYPTASCVTTATPQKAARPATLISSTESS